MGTLSVQPVSARETGLTDAEVEQSRRTHGANSFTQKKREGFFHQYLDSFGDPIIKILLAALAINIVFMFRTQNWFETVGIAVAVLLATLVSTLSEYGSESAFIKLQEEAAKIQCLVRRREGVRSIPISEVVVGDLVLLQAGERVPADGILISGELRADQSALNGESREARKLPLTQQTPTHWDLAEKNQLFRGSVIMSGEGVLRVCRVGDQTFYGGMAQELQEEGRESPLKVKLATLANTISGMGYKAAALIAFADLFNNLVIDNAYQMPLISAELHNLPVMMQNLLHAAILAISVVVVAVPEGLPMMITVVLSSNMFRMLKDKVMVRKLIGIETAGSLNILFTDKTGTLTKGSLTVAKFISGDGTEFPNALALKQKRPLWELVELSSSLNTGSVPSQGRALGGNATDRALLDYVLPLSSGRGDCMVERTIPFDSANKFSAVRVGGARQLVLVKGAPEKLFPQCSSYYDQNGRLCPLENRSALAAKWREMTGNAMRVLALATAERECGPDGRWENLTLIGLAGIRDELRSEVRRAVDTVHTAGIQLVMITGDNRETAVAIAKEAGLLRDLQKEKVLTSSELSALGDGELKEILPKLRVVARALPADKSRLVRVAQEMGLVVGMTGDGINDTPALKKADVGFAMGSGTEVAKEAGDIVILDDNFASITRAVLYGRTIFKSIRKFITFQLTMNLCAVGVSLIGPFIGIDTPVTVVQMLWVNIIMDTLGGLAFAGEPPLEEYMREPPKKREEPIISKGMLHQILCLGLFTVALCVGFLKLEFIKPLFRFGSDPIYFLTAFFALFIFAGIFNSFSARTPRINIFSNLTQNHSFGFIMCVVALVQLTMIYYGGSLFRTAGLTLRELLTVIGLALLVIPADMLRKLASNSLHRHNAY